MEIASLIKNPIFLGGIVPMIFFGCYNFFVADVSKNFSLAEILIAISVAGLFSALILHFFFGQSVHNAFVQMEWWKVILVAFLWVVGVCGLTFAFSMGGSVSVLIPLVNANTFISIFLAIFLGNENFSWQILIGSILIVLGSVVLLWKNT